MSDKAIFYMIEFRKTRIILFWTPTGFYFFLHLKYGSYL